MIVSHCIAILVAKYLGLYKCDCIPVMGCAVNSKQLVPWTSLLTWLAVKKILKLCFNYSHCVSVEGYLFLVFKDFLVHDCLQNQLQKVF